MIRTRTAGDGDHSKPRAPLPRIAVLGAGLAGIVCARTLAQAGHTVTLFERQAAVGGRMATRETPFGTFDEGAQYFTVRDARFAHALEVAALSQVKSWSARSVRVLDPAGRSLATAPPTHEPHQVAVPGMDALPRHWAEPLAAAGALQLQTEVRRIARDALDPTRWQLHTDGADGGTRVFSGFDAVLLALPAGATRELLEASGLRPAFVQNGQLGGVRAAPCWTLLAAFPQAARPNLITLGPHWNAARSTHHRIAWLARESSKPQRSGIERWTVQASAAWSDEHIGDDPARAQAKLLKAFAEITGIHATPGWAAVRLWREARTMTPAGVTHLWDRGTGLGACGDWCLGHRVEDAFVSGLSLALAVL